MEHGLTHKPFHLLPLLLGTSMAFANSSAPVPADNSAVNKRDRQEKSLVPEDQAQGSKRDVELTQKLRKELTGLDDMSTYAKNVKIVTLDGVVTLRGPVKTETEKERVATLAQKVAGPANVRNELEVAH